jgi:hypothetical protein
VLHSEDALSLAWGSLVFCEKGGPSIGFQQPSDDDFLARVNEAFGSASGQPFAKENLHQATRWLHFRGLVVSEATSRSGAHQIVKYLTNETPHGFHLRMPDGQTIVPKGLLLLVAIAHIYAIRVVIFSTRRKPIEIVPATDGGCSTVALLRHQDSILSVGEWYLLEPAKNWIKQIATAQPTFTPPMTSPAAVQRPQGAAPKRKVPANYASIGDDTLRDLLRSVM